MQIWQNDTYYMNCPNCKSAFKPEKIGSTVYWRCSKCNALWFDNKENDFLTLEEANTLKKLAPDCSFSKINYSCPRCNKPLSFDKHYFRCYSCGGVLSSSTAIFDEIKAKTTNFASKIAKPFNISQLKYVAVLGMIIAFIGINFYLFNSFANKMSIQTQAEQISTNIRIQKINNQKLAIYFASTEPYQSVAIFSSDSEKWEKTISKELSLNHFLIIDIPKKPTTLTVRLISANQEELTTVPMALSY